MQFRISRVDTVAGFADESLAQFKGLWKARHWWWLAEDAVRAEWAGYGAISVFDRETAFFGPYYVREKYRGHGIQRRIIAAQEAVAKEMGFTRSVSSVEIGNVASANSLIGAGFKMIEAWPWVVEAGIYFGKSLAG